MRLTAMADAYRMQTNDNSLNELSFEERMGLLIDIEYRSRKNNRLKRLIKKATFDQPHACIADINYTADRKLDKALITRLANCDYIADKHNVILMGATGVGKTYLACALGLEACKQFYSTKYVRLPELLSDLAVARGLGIFSKVIDQYRKYQLLIIDEWMLIALTETEAKDLLEIIHYRHKRGSTIFCSQFSCAGWYTKIKEAVLADAILDRIVHDSYMVEIQSDPKRDKSMREYYGINRKQQV